MTGGKGLEKGLLRDVINRRPLRADWNYLVNYLREKLESVLLFPNINRLAEKSETSPEFFWDVMLKLLLQQMTENVLKLIKDRLFIHSVHLDVQNLKYL